LDLSLVRRQRRTGVATHDSLEALNGSIGVGEQRAAQKLVVEASAKHAALAVVERGAEAIVVLDFGDESLQLSRRGVVARRDIVELIVDDVGFGDELGPEIGLRLIVLELRDGSAMSVRPISTVQIGRKFGKAADRAGIAVAAGRRVERRVILHDIDNVEQVVVGRTRGDVGIRRVLRIKIIDLQIDLIEHGLKVNGRQRGIGADLAEFNRVERGRIVDQIGQASRNRFHIGVELTQIGCVEPANGEIGSGIEDRADLRQRRPGCRSSGERGRIIRAYRQSLETDIVRAGAGWIGIGT